MRLLQVALNLEGLASALGEERGHPIRNALRNRKARHAIIAAVRDNYAMAQEEGEERPFWEWLWEHREEILEFVLKIISIFAAL